MDWIAGSWQCYYKPSTEHVCTGVGAVKRNARKLFRGRCQGTPRRPAVPPSASDVALGGVQQVQRTTKLHSRKIPSDDR